MNHEDRQPQRSHANEVVITGAGLITCLGLSRQQTWEGVKAGRCGMGPLTAIESTLPPDAIGGQAPPLPPDDSQDNAREAAYLRAAVAEAVAEAYGDDIPPYPSRRCGVFLGTTLHGMRHGGDLLRSGNLESLRYFLAGSTARYAIEGLGLEGFAATTCSACSSGLASIALGVTSLQSGELDLVVAGGYDPISEYAYGGFNSMRLVTPGRMRPFAEDRDGMKLAEGYGVVVLERIEAARRRKARVWARIVGFGESCDAHHLSKPHPEGAGATAAMRAALHSARLTPNDIDMIAAHATSTPNNDAAEFAALQTVYGDRLPAVPVVAFKSHLGHTLGGAGAVELILSMSALSEGVVPPCGNAEDKVAFPGMNVTRKDAMPARLRHVMNTSLGFGGANVSMILGRGDETADCAQHEVSSNCEASPASMGFSSSIPAGSPRVMPPAVQNDIHTSEVWITGVGVVLPGAVGNEAFMDRISAEKGIRFDSAIQQLADGEIDHLINARRVRRMSEYAKLTLAATAVALADAGIKDAPAFGETCAALLGTTHGPADYCETYYRGLVADGISAANPLLFAEGVPNAAGAHLSTAFGIKGFCQTIVGTRTAGLDALRLAAARIRAGIWHRAIVSAAEEATPLVQKAHEHFDSHASGRGEIGQRLVTGCGAVSIILERDASVAQRGGRRRGRIQGAIGAITPVQDPPASIKAVRDVLRGIDYPRFLVGSFDERYFGRMTRAAIGIAYGRRSSAKTAPVLSSIHDRMPEVFSVNPLAAVVAVLLSGRLPRCPTDRSSRIRRIDPARGDETADRFGVLCMGFDGSVSGVRITCR